jgi:hypothetical protein
MDNTNNFSSTTDLEVDSDSVHLGAPQEITEASPHAAKHELAGWGVRAEITHLEHGLMNDDQQVSFASSCTSNPNQKGAVDYPAPRSILHSPAHRWPVPDNQISYQLQW